MPLGIVSVVYGDRCEVLEDGRTRQCLLRGRLKGTSLAVGDHVEFQTLDERTGVVERILPRRNELSRSNRERPRRRTGAGAYPRQVVLANPDQVVFVAAARDPGIPLELMDRALALARAARLPSVLCINKMDLAPDAEIRRLMRPYERMGIPVVYASAETGLGLEALSPLLRGRTSFFWGGSGVGKSSLIRALTGQDVKVGRWRTDNPRGPHTTNVTRLYPLPEGGLIADTPGFDWLALDTVEEDDEAVDLLLPESRALAGSCRFPGCTHCGEPGCAVMAAVLRGELDRGRYARFRTAMAESHPSPALPFEVVATVDELFFRRREGNSTLWTTFGFQHLFQPGSDEREGLLEALGVPPDDPDPLWVVFQHRAPASLAARAGGRVLLTAKLTGSAPVEERLAPEQELIFRERGVVKGLGSVRDLWPEPDVWRLRKRLKATPVYDFHGFWTDLKPPPGAALPPVHGAVATFGGLTQFEPLPQLALGALTRQETGLVLDYLEIGSSEDELAKQ